MQLFALVEVFICCLRCPRENPLIAATWLDRKALQTREVGGLKWKGFGGSAQTKESKGSGSEV